MSFEVLSKNNKTRKNLELLAPAGNRASFEAALNAGADAIYLGIERFNARRNADNFSIDELPDIVKAAHLRGVKLYVAFNTLISGQELLEAVESLALIKNAGADAVIVQDWGILEFIRRNIPDLNIHASTQMNTHNSLMARFLEEKGVKRITLARELSLGEIAQICQSTNLEIETFIHGALCFSYSGQCLFSSMIGNRSGNRGLCPQACRMKYSLITRDCASKEEKMPGNHILSTRDLCGLRLIPELAEAGVKALKVEGRMKSAEYVAIVVRIYRQAIDRYLENPSEFFILDSEVDELKEAFNRGFTEGYMKGIRDNRLMSFERPNDRGLLIGRVTYIDVYTGKLGMQARREVCQGDEIEIWVSRGGRVKVKVEELLVNGKRVQCAPAGSKVVTVVKEKRHRIKAGDRVFRVHNERMAKAAKELISGESAKKVPINIRAEIELGKPIKLEACVDKMVDDSSYTKERAEVTSDFLVEKGERKTLDVSGVIAQLSRLGNSVYQVRSWDILLEPGVMVPLGRLNELRRSLIERLDQARLKVHEKPKISVNEVRKRLLDELKAKEKGKCHRSKRQRIVLTVDVSNTDQAKEAIQNGADWVYLRRGFSRLGNFNLGELAKLCAGMGVKTALATGNIAHDSEIGDIIKLVEELADNIDAILVDNFGVYSAVESLGLPIFLDYHLNNFNRLSLKTFDGSTVSRVCLSPELSLEQISQIADSTEIEIEMLIHGWLEVMTAEHCIPSILKGSCKICSKSKFYIEDAKRFRFPVEQDIKCRSHVYNSHELYLLPNISSLVKAGISSMRLLLNRYEPEIAGRITSVYSEAIDLVAAGMDDVSIALDRAESFINDSKTTTGHYFKAVD